MHAYSLRVYCSVWTESSQATRSIAATRVSQWATCLVFSMSILQQLWHGTHLNLLHWIPLRSYVHLFLFDYTPATPAASRHVTWQTVNWTWQIADAVFSCDMVESTISTEMYLSSLTRFVKNRLWPPVVFTDDAFKRLSCWSNRQGKAACSTSFITCAR